MRIRQLFTMTLLVLVMAVPARAFDESKFEKYRREGVSIVHVTQAPPLSFIGHDGKPNGVIVDLWTKWSEKTGVPVSFEIIPWAETIEALIQGTYDIHGGLLDIEERQQQLSFSVPIIPISSALITKGTQKVDYDTVIAESRIGAIAGAYTGLYLEKHHPEVNLTYYPTPKELMIALENEDIHAVSMDLPTFHINAYQYTPGLKYTISKTMFQRHLQAGVVKGNEPLLELINEGMKRIDQAERDVVFNRWYVSAQSEEESDSTILWGALAIGLLAFTIYFIIRKASA